MVPHLGLPVQGQLRGHALREFKVSWGPGPGGPIPALLGRIWRLSRPGGQHLESRMPNEPLRMGSASPEPPGSRFMPMSTSSRWVQTLFGKACADHDAAPGTRAQPRPPTRDTTKNPSYATPRKDLNHSLCYAILLAGRKSAFRAGFWPDCYQENTEIGPRAAPHGKYVWFGVLCEHMD